jgi:hypothetical protein
MTAKEKRRDYEPRRPSRSGRHDRCFAMVPCEVLYDAALSDGAVRYYAVIARWACTRPGPDAGRTPPVAQRQLAADLGGSQATARRYQTELVEAGHLVVEGCNGRWSVYVLPWITEQIGVDMPVRLVPTALTDERGTALTDERGLRRDRAHR